MSRTLSESSSVYDQDFMIYDTDLKHYWHNHFENLFNKFLSYGHYWTLRPTLNAPDTDSHSKWFCSQDVAKVRFVCMGCGKRWSSVKGKIAFWYRLNANIYIFLKKTSVL
jgi:hypothetical protein